MTSTPSHRAVLAITVAPEQQSGEVQGDSKGEPRSGAQGRAIRDVADNADADARVDVDASADSDQLQWLHLATSPSPAHVVIDRDGSRAAVTCTWSRCIDLFELVDLFDANGTKRGPRAGKRAPLQRRKTVALDFQPRLALFLPGGESLVVADAFAGRMAVVDWASGRVTKELDLGGHAIGGMVLSPDQRSLVVTHQLLDSTTPTTRENIESGRLVGSFLRWIPVEELRRTDGVAPSKAASSTESKRTVRSAPSASRHQSQHRFVRLDELTDGAADPAGLAFDSDGRLHVALAGVQQVLMIEADSIQRLQTTADGTDVEKLLRQPLAAPGSRRGVSRMAVGQRPRELVAADGGRTIVIVNSLDDSLSVFEPSIGSASRRTVSLGPASLEPALLGPAPLGQSPLGEASLGPRERGERLFFDGRMSRHGMLSCHSCHVDGHTTGQLADTRGDDSFGTPKRTLTLLGGGITYRWAWNGTQANLHDQVAKSLNESMHGERTTYDRVTDMVAFLHSLRPPPPSQPRAVDEADRVRIERGKRLFDRLDCGRCHIPPLVYTSHEAYDVGLSDEAGLKKFNPPSLRGVGQGRRFFHDNRAESLESVFSDFNHP
ncbi:MAG TPA: cytochrome c peroxidase, partial [Pirellulaceae bacterium]|nr:cytochrome c peroxidase [Pirellulaceae bacterium]